jgi:hypothetical protein
MSAPNLEPPELDVPQVLARDWINRHGIFRTVSTGGPKERTGTDWSMVITEAARWGQRQSWDARGATTELGERQARPAIGPGPPAGFFPVEYADADGDGIRILMEPSDETGRACWVVRNSRLVNPCHEFPTPEAAYAAHRTAAAVEGQGNG